MGKSLVIVESPAKARTISGYLGADYAVGSSVGHVRDLPNRAKDVPEAQRKRFGALGVDVEKGFEPYYVVDPGKKKIIADLKKRLSEADELLLATDEDREGEAIAWHLVEVLKPKVPVRRMVFHEITKDAITRALDDTRAIDDRLVDAQETRRILDRLYGYEVSPVLWKKVTRGLSAGRVQSVATRLVVQRERERMAFRSAEYWDLLATFDPGTFEARLVSVDGARVAQGRDFEPTTGALRESGVVHLDEAAARGLAERLEDTSFAVRSVEERPYRRKPAAPFRTATLQQEASRKLRFSAQTTMRVAQRLYESGYITYMRTDSTTLSESAIAASRAQVAELFGDDFVPAKPRLYGRAVANAQEAHEAIRPAGDRFRTPKELGRELNRDELALYDLVWKRTLASQMEDARGQTVSLRIGGASSSGEDVEFGASGTVITFRGFLAAYEPGKDEPTDDEEERVLPPLAVGQDVTLASLEPDGHATVPPARYTEPTLVRALEERGIGRPSTYAAILSTIVDRGYVFKKGTALVPTFVAFSVVNVLERHFEQLVDFDFTARMEHDLDRIAAGEQARDEWLEHFYFGDGNGPGLHHLVTDNLGEIDARAVNSIEIPGSEAVVRVGRYGPYLEHGERRASLPADLAPDELTPERAEELLSQPDNRPLGTNPQTGREIVVRSGRYGPYVTEVMPEGAQEKPPTASLLSSMSPETVTLEDALRLLSLPRVVGELDGEEVTALNGRYGPYIKRGEESRSLESEEQLFTVTLEQAKALLAEPPRRRRRGAAKGPLRELGSDPASGKPIVLRDGRFGPYVTDGETNASLRRGDTVEGVTLERAVELLAERRAKSE
ncbi:MAG TPA: type I DNA topoisomerase [Gaiellaceae bacterium]|nr:type I DNA topoisomerase [Gaiellaceae bacterium]